MAGGGLIGSAPCLRRFATHAHCPPPWPHCIRDVSDCHPRPSPACLPAGGSDCRTPLSQRTLTGFCLPHCAFHPSPSCLQDDTTFTAHIKPFAKSMAEGPRAAVPGCTPRTGPAEPVVQSFEGDKPAAKAGRKLLA